MIRTIERIQYPVRGPFLNRGVAPTEVPPGSYAELSGIDGRFNGCLRKFYGMKKVVDLDDVTGGIDAYDGPSYFKAVTFQKYGTTTMYRGFVVRWDEGDDNTNEAVDLFYTVDNGSNWLSHEIVAQSGSGITSTTAMDCATDGPYLYVSIAGVANKTVYWNGSALTTIAMGPGIYNNTLVALADPDTKSVDSSYELRGDGRYQVAWRFYDSTRGVYSALSDPVTISMDLFKTTKATGTVSFSSAGGDSGLMVAGDVFTINSRTYEYIDADSDVTISAAGAATVAAHATALADAINGDSSAVVSAKAESADVLLESKIRGATGNGYDLSVSETGANRDDITVSGTYLTGGGVSTSDPEEHCKAVLNFPDNTAVVTGSPTWAGFTALFDTVDVFRTIDLGTGATATQGAIFYLEQTISKVSDWDTNAAEWDALTVTVGTKLDEALPFQTQYNPETDVVKAPPTSGAIGRYQDVTFMGDVWGSGTRGVDTVHSSMEHESGEYFSTYNTRKGDIERGTPYRYMRVGDSMFILAPGGVTHVYKAGQGKPLQYVDLHEQRGLVGREAAHAAGNSIFMVSTIGLVMMNGANGNMAQISAADRLIFDDWAGDLTTVKSAYDSKMNASFFLNSTDNQTLMIYHSTQSTGMLEGTNFVGASSGLDIPTGLDIRAHFITAKGVIVTPDWDLSGNGNMFGLTSAGRTLDGTTTGAASKTSIVDSGATFHADMIGALLYCTDGENAGVAREITAVPDSNTLTVSTFANDVALGDRYSVSPVPFKVRLWPLRDPDPRVMDTSFKRWIMTGVAVKCRKLSGFTSNDNNKWRIGAYRNGSDTLETTTVEIDVDSNAADSAGALPLDGIDLETYIEQISTGTQFEFIGAEVHVKMTESREVTA